MNKIEMDELKVIKIAISDFLERHPEYFQEFINASLDGIRRSNEKRADLLGNKDAAFLTLLGFSMKRDSFGKLTDNEIEMIHRAINKTSPCPVETAFLDWKKKRV